MLLQRNSEAFNVWKVARIHFFNGTKIQIYSFKLTVWGVTLPTICREACRCNNPATCLNEHNCSSYMLQSSEFISSCCVCLLQIIFRNPLRRMPCNPAFVLFLFFSLWISWYPWPLIGIIKLSIIPMHSIKLYHIKHRPEIKSLLSKEHYRYSFFSFTTTSSFSSLLSLYRG